MAGQSQDGRDEWAGASNEDVPALPFRIRRRIGFSLQPRRSTGTSRVTARYPRCYGTIESPNVMCIMMNLPPNKWALNSAVECHPHTVEVVGSNPTAPTISARSNPETWVFKPVLTPARHHNWTEPLRKMEADALAQLDAEPRYSTGTLLSYCGRKDAAVRLNRTILPTPPCNPTPCLRASEKVRSSTNCCLPPNSARIDFWRNAAETNNPRWQLFRFALPHSPSKPRRRRSCHSPPISELRIAATYLPQVKKDNRS